MNQSMYSIYLEYIYFPLNINHLIIFFNLRYFLSSRNTCISCRTKFLFTILEIIVSYITKFFHYRLLITIRNVINNNNNCTFSLYKSYTRNIFNCNILCNVSLGLNFRVTKRNFLLHKFYLYM